MCDTLILRHQGQTWFAKNSDREPAEPQRLLRLPAVRNDPEARLRTTYLDIPQTAQRHALVISQPSVRSTWPSRLIYWQAASASSRRWRCCSALRPGPSCARWAIAIWTTWSARPGSASAPRSKNKR